MSIVYVLSNEAMPGLVKIGLTTDLNQRLSQLYSSGVPLPFTCEYAARVDSAEKVEKALHQAFGDKRLHERREFFELEPIQARVILELLAEEEVTTGIYQQDVTKEETKVVAEKSERRKRFNFRLVGIEPGAILTYHSNPAITAIVQTNTKIKFREEIVSLSAAASILLVEEGYEWAERSCAGPIYWSYEGETLHERRLRLENEED